MQPSIPRAGLVLAASLILTSGSVAAAQDWKFQINVNAGDDEYRIAQQWAKSVGEKTGGEINIEVLPTGTIVGNNETLDAVGAGIIQGHITDPGYFSGKNPAFAVYGNMVGAWSGPAPFLDYMRNAGGEAGYNRLVEPYNVHLIRAGAVGAESLISKRKIESLDDLKGLKVRAPEGMVSNIFKLVGAAPVNLPTSEVYTGLEKGVIDAADYTVFSTNYQQGYHKYAPFAVYPGFHSMPMKDISVNKALWDELSPEQQKILEDSVDAFTEQLVSDLQKKDEEQVALAKQKGDVTLTSLSEGELKKFRQSARDEWSRWRDRSPQAKEAVDSIQTYLQDKGML
ncbi:TRAP transporter substrate-binding protein DctP [Stutzerimonas stutzeri]|uniref:TRAP transporter substrate-binding protein DctP n=1 Tax=Stutzerimonas TaxID=2901164 RepID=UPI000C9B7710|nr:TRAP transporter substrate-binding protein DctP [Stutzerimonas stutzeri]MCI0919232.1 TRAP transporter substrate-binding protein DctP [Stutzerimonas stutzeri]PNG13565.1 C4-dicarboxylate ABC transporter substrate-binding protein [Stutzerimonas stutzeri]QUE74256.1 TRAP transporter substrate-binding protein DctP [Stutzerimonas stutzeri]